MIELVMLFRDYPAASNYYDWDLLAFEYWRLGRECIIPEVGADWLYV